MGMKDFQSQLRSTVVAGDLSRIVHRTRSRCGAACLRLINSATPGQSTIGDSAAISQSSTNPPSESQTCLDQTKSLIGMAVDQWRLTRRIQRLEAASPDANVSGITDSAQRIGESLQELGVTTAEHDGAIHDPGALYEVVHIRDECDTQVVVETIAPSVLINGKIVKHGQVVIGCERTEESGT